MKKIILLIGLFMLLFNNFIYAETNSHDEPMIGTQSSAYAYGSEIKIRENCNITAVNTFSTVTATTLYVWNGSTHYNNYSISSNTATITDGIIANQNETWSFLVSSGGSSFTTRYGDVGGYPTNGTGSYIEWIQPLSQSTGIPIYPFTDNTRFADIESIEVFNISDTPPTPPTPTNQILNLFYNYGTEKPDVTKNQSWIYINIGLSVYNQTNITYNLYDSDLTLLQNVTNNLTSYNFTDLSNETYYYDVTAYNINGTRFNISDYGTTYESYGDSIAEGYGCGSILTDRYTEQIANNRSLTYTNTAVGGSQLQDSQITAMYGENTSNDHERYTLLTGVNDIRHWWNTAGGLQSYTNSLYTASAWLGLRDDEKIRGRDSRVSYTGTWSNTGVYGLGKTSSTQNDYLEVNVSGDVIYIASISQTPDQGNFSIYVDDVLQGNYNCSEGVLSGSGTGVTYSPQLIRLTGLSNSEHAVNLTVTSSSGAVYFDWIAGINTTSYLDRPIFYLGNILYFTSGGYSTYMSGSSGEATTDLWNNNVFEVFQNLSSDGLNIIHINMSEIYDPDLGACADGLHPNQTGHDAISSGYIDNIESYEDERKINLNFEIIPPILSLLISNQTLEGSINTITINTTAIDTESGLNEHKINITYPNGTLYFENTTVGGNFEQIFGTFNILGLYNVTTYAEDNNGNSVTNESYFNVTDTTEPSLTWSEPSLNASYVNDTLINLTMNVTCDDLIGLENITMFVNGVINQTNTSPVNNTPWSFTFYPTEYATYNINFSCYDNSDNVNNSDTRTFTYSAIPTTTVTTTTSLGGGSGSPTAQTSGDCPPGYISYNYKCIADTYLTKFSLLNFDTSVCPTKKVFWSFNNLNNLDETEKADDMYIIFKYNDGTKVNQSLSYFLNKYNYNDYIDFKGQDSLIIELQSVFDVAGDKETISYKTNIVPGTCNILSDFELIPTVQEKIDNIKNVTSSTWNNVIYNDDGTKNKKNVTAMIILLMTLIVTVYYLVFKK